MAMKSVQEGEAGYDFVCPDPICQRPAPPDGEPRPFTSKGWPTRKAAELRGKEHLAEHKSGEPMRELVYAMADTGVAYPDPEV